MKKYLLTLLVILLPIGCLAKDEAIPRKCPDVKLIRQVGINNRLFKDSNGLWYGGRSSQYYNTNQHWTFIIGNISADDNDEAHRYANAALKTIRLDRGPMQGRDRNEYVCLYMNHLDYLALTVTPPLKQDDRMKTLYAN